MKITTLLLALLVGSQAMAFNYNIVEKQVGSAKIGFLKNADVKLNENNEEGFYSLKADYAEIERLAPLRKENLAALNANDFRNLTMEEFNQIYARLGSGPMPYGDYSGFIMQKPHAYEALKKRILRQVKAVSKVADIAKTVCQRDAEDCIFEFIWKGKRFYKKNDMDQVEARTTVNVVSAGFKFSDLIPGFLKSSSVDRALDFAEGLVDKASVTMFPMNTYCGISQVDVRRESIITDGTYGDDFSGFIGARDDIITRKNLNITEEYRMVRPGLYIGKAYTNKIFLFNLVLQKTGNVKQTDTANACFDGTKTR